MKKLYVDEIFKNGKELNEPGPGSYEKSKTFGVLQGAERYSVRPKNDLFVHHLSRQKKLPGPGSYFATVDLAGRSQSNSKLLN